MMTMQSLRGHLGAVKDAPNNSRLSQGDQHLYPHLALVAHAWQAALGQAMRFPSELSQMLARCDEAGQMRPAPLILKSGAGDCNRPHQDLHVEHVFPLQAAFLLSQPGADFAGSDFGVSRPSTRSCPGKVGTPVPVCTAAQVRLT
jgi:hypothetical protein